MKNKHYSIISILLTVLLSCSKNAYEISSFDTHESSDFDTKAATFNHEVTERIAEENTVSMQQAILYVNKTHKGTIKDVFAVHNERDTSFYVVNFEDGGWIIISGDKRTNPVLAFSDEGKFDADYLNTPGVEEWADYMSNEIKNVRYSLIESTVYSTQWSELLCNTDISQTYSYNNARTDVPTSTNEILWEKVLIGSTSSSSTSTVGPLLQTNWGQGHPWNYKCPSFVGYVYGQYSSFQSVTGCVAVALAQILYFNKYEIGKPYGLYHDIDCSDYYTLYDEYYQPYAMKVNLQRSNYTFDSTRWDSMALDSLSGAANLTAAHYVGDLMMDVGDRVDMSYWKASSSSIWNAYYALAHYGLNGVTVTGNYNFQTIKNDIDNRMPMYIRAISTEYPYPGHAWVLDGYRLVTTTVQKNYRWLISSNGTYTSQEMREMFPDEKIEDGMESTEEETSTIGYIHMNWGFNGKYNGFFLEGSAVVWNVGQISFLGNKQLIYMIH